MIRRVRFHGGPVCKCDEQLAEKLVASGWEYTDVEKQAEEAPAPKRRGRPPKKDADTEE